MSIYDELRALRDEYLAVAEALATGDFRSESLNHSNFARRLDAILAEYADWVVVPKEPTEAMLSAAAEVGGTKKRQTYKAMIRAAAKAEEE